MQNFYEAIEQKSSQIQYCLLTFVCLFNYYNKAIIFNSMISIDQEKKQGNIVIRILEWNCIALDNFKFILQYCTYIDQY